MLKNRYQFLFRICCICLLSCSSQSEIAPNSRKSSGLRLVTLAPSATEILVALGKENQLVGRDEYSVSPKQLQVVPVVGDFLSPNIEAIVRLSPDLVLLDQSQEKANDALKALGLSTLPLAMHQLTDVRSALLKVGERLEAGEKAEALVRLMDEDINKYKLLRQRRATTPTVLVLIDRDPDTLRNLIAAGPSTYIDELLTLVGVRNMMAGSPVRYPQISAEQILRAAPDIIIDLSKSEGGLAAYASIAEAPAMRERRVHILHDPVLLAPTPRLGEALAKLYAITEMNSTL